MEGQPGGTMLRRCPYDSDRGFGKRPGERTIQELLACGVIALDKPPGPSSHQVAAWVRDMLEVEKAGQGGTLDPNVTGVLPVLLNAAAKAVPALLHGDKEYTGIMRLHRDVPEAKVRDIFAEFTGDIYQFPPVKSAVKRERRVRSVHELELLESQERDVLFRVRCESGTYIRTLCHDIGQVLGAGAHMQELRRTRAGPLGEREAVTLHFLKDAWEFWKEGDDGELRRVLQPVEALLRHLPRIVIRDSAVDAVCHGADLAVPGVVEVEAAIAKGKYCCVYTAKGEAVALGTALMAAPDIAGGDTGVALDVERVLMERGTYPRAWRRKAKDEG